jgi:hypothetical protein
MLPPACEKKDPDLKGSYGYFHAAGSMISIDESISLEMQWYILDHEMGHAAFDYSGGRHVIWGWLSGGAASHAPKKKGEGRLSLDGNLLEETFIRTAMQAHARAVLDARGVA